MNIVTKTALLASLPAALVAAIPATVFAQAAAPAPALAGGGVAIADLEEAVNKSNAWVLAVNQIKITHKDAIARFEARATAINAELQPYATQIQTAQRAPNPNQAAIQTQVTAFQKRQADAEQELQALRMPVTRSEAFAKQQIFEKLELAARAAMTKRRIGLLLKPDAAQLNATSADITTDIITEINTLVPSVNSNPPANWPPQQGAAGAAPGAAQPAIRPQPPKPQPQGR